MLCLTSVLADEPITLQEKRSDAGPNGQSAEQLQAGNSNQSKAAESIAKPKAGKQMTEEEPKLKPLPKVRNMSKAERRKLAEAEEALLKRQEQRDKVLKNARQTAWAAVTVILVVGLSVALIRVL